MIFSKQLIPVIDFRSGKVIKKNKSRLKVHKSGDWHRAINAFILRKNKKGYLEILSQERSSFVDIAQEKIDQSLAAQLLVLDNDDITKALYRALKEELGIYKKNILRIKLFNALNSFKITKRYFDNKDLYNREFINIFGIVLKENTTVKSTCIRVKSTTWISWDSFVELININPKRFTKTARMLCIDKSILEKLNIFFETLIQDKIFKPLYDNYHLISLYEHDVVVAEDKNKNYNINIYESKETIRLIRSYKKIKDIMQFFLDKFKIPYSI